MDKNQGNDAKKGIDIESLTAEQATQSNAIEIPSISLPKGGGAIRSIDETFKVNASNGTGSCGIPLPITPGRNGFSPALNFSYGSGSGNGFIGLGWQLNLASITRKTDKGLPRYQEGSREDVFLFSEAEDLVVFNEEVAPGDWQPLDFTDGDYHITRYRPRVEGGFARIEKITHDSHLSYWKVTTQENMVTIFGRSPLARIADPSAPERIYKWLPEFSYDNQGNWIKYEYKAEDNANVPPLPHERNRINGNAAFTNRYIKRIRYGNRVAWYADETRPYAPQATLDNGHLFELVFDYGEHHAAVPQSAETPGLTWSYREDAFSSYRSGFEIRTNRLCQRVLMFHHFSDELEFGVDYLVRSLQLEYAASSINQSGMAEVNYLAKATHSGYIRKNDSSYAQKSLPAIEYSYQQLEWNQEIKVVDEENLVNAPAGLKNGYQWVDLYGEGISGILSEQATGLYYKSNLGDINHPGSVAFTPAQPVLDKPSVSGFNNGVLSVRDLTSSGEKQIVVESPGLSGYYQLTEDNRWQPFQSFEALANIDFSSPDLRRFDITGDGQAELVISEEQAFVWYVADGKKGYQAAERASRVFDEELGPVAMFSDTRQSIYLADMSGDGLTDIVRIRNGDICYWPNLGYGRFGAKVNMSNAPVFDLPDIFNPQYLHLADISGTGVTDILYLAGRQFQAYLNHSGNSWSENHTIDAFFPMDQNAGISVVDLMGSGTSCIVWSSDLPTLTNNPMRYIDLMSGKKPHVLIRIQNNLGQETTMEYKSSTYFYLKDKLAGKPWATKLPFPVQVLSRVVTEDKITKASFSSQYHYRHGYYDTREKEFRGFGLVEQTDSEYYEQWKANSAGTNLELSEDFYQPPMLTKTWYHTGAFNNREKILNQFENEYWFNAYDRQFPTAPLGISEPRLPEAEVTALDSILQPDVMDHLSADEWREAVRTCKGMILRQEVFALDAPRNGATEQQLKLQALPYSVSTSSCRIRLVQPRLENRSNVFLLNGSQNLELQYERTPDDVRINHTITLRTDAFNQVLEEAGIVYARNADAANAVFQNLTGRVSDFSGFDEPVKLQDAFAANIVDAAAAQTTTHITVTQNIYTNAVESQSQYRLPLVAENKTYHITGLTAAGDLFEPLEFENILEDSVSTEIDYGDSGTAGIERRRIEHFQTLYYKDDLTGALPLGQLASCGLSFENYQLAFTPQLVNRLYGAKIAAPFTPLVEAKYIDLNGDGHWWVRSGTFNYIDSPGGETVADARGRFYAPRAYTDAFGTQTVVQYRANYDALLLESVIDALGNRTRVETFNFRTLAPTRMRDINDNLSQVLVDELGMVKATAYLGKDIDGDGVAELDPADDLMGLPEAGESEDAAITAFLEHVDSNNIVADGKALLKNASRRFVYDLNAYKNTSKPAVAVSIQREQHASILADSPLQIRYEYSDGSGNVAMVKAQAEPGEAKQVIINPDDSYTVAAIDTSLLVPSQLRWIGTGREVLNNKGKTVRKFEPYFSVTPGFEDLKEIVEAGVSPMLYYDPVGRLIKTHMPDQSFSKAVFDSWQEQQFDQNDTVMDSQWYQDRINRTIDAELLALGKNPMFEQAAAQRAAAHHNTPNAIYLDSLGRPVLSLSHNGLDAGNKELFYLTFVALDIEGNATSVRDARGNTVMEYKYDMLGHRVYQNSMDSGERWLLNNVVSKPHTTWDGKSQVFIFQYDTIQRPVEMKVTGGEDPLNPLDNVYEKLIYGEDRPNDKVFNLRGKPVSRYDTAGKLTFHHYDRMGALLSSTRQVTIDYKNMVNWQGSGLDAMLEPSLYNTLHNYDALGRPVSSTSPDLSVTDYGYTEADLLGTVNVTQAGVAKKEYVEAIRYDEKGRRLSIHYRSGIVSKYRYDPETSRPIHLETRKGNGEILQDIYYTYDPMGNIIYQEDKSQPIVFFNNQKTESVSSYTYDALYQLIEATGREHAGQQINFSAADNWQDGPFQKTYAPGDVMAWRNYTQQFEYDPVGNKRQHRHVAAAGNWTRSYAYDPGNNRLTSTTVGADTHTYSYHANHGYMTRMPHLPVMQSNFKDQLQAVSRQSVAGGFPETTYYMYDSGGQRIRKVTDTAAEEGGVPVKQSERLYLSGSELYIKHSGANAGLQRSTLHVMDDARRIAIIDTRNDIDDGTDKSTVRFQFGNHLESVSIETDDNGDVISYEEYHPFGTTAYQAMSSSFSVSTKRYRYTGKERDQESGFVYFGARYYICWLGRWLSADPSGIKDGVNVYCYVNNKPISYRDPSGLWDWPSWETVAVVTAVVVVGTVATVATAGAAGPVVAGVVASVGLSGTAATVATGAAVGVVAGAVGGAAAGAAGETTRQVAHGESLDGGRILSEAGSGAVTGAAIGGAIGGAIPLVAAGATAAAGTTGGAAVVAGARSAAQSVASSAVGRGAAAVAQRAASSSAGQAAGAVVRTTGGAVQAVHNAGLRAGGAAAARTFASGSQGAQAAARFVASGGSAAATFRQAASSADDVAAGAAGSTAGAADDVAVAAADDTATGAAAGVANSGDDMVTVYRGVNQSHYDFAAQSQGVVRPNNQWWQFWKGRGSSPIEHNVGRGGTLNSPYTSWTTDPEVAINFALRPGPSPGVVITAEVPRSSIIASPNMKDVVLIQGGGIVSEAEVFLRGTIRGIVRSVTP
nr:SpvB/TcaC N-terminal domain-containing protein [uncultured Desulfobacter sp.]